MDPRPNVRFTPTKLAGELYSELFYADRTSISALPVGAGKLLSDSSGTLCTDAPDV